MANILYRWRWHILFWVLYYVGWTCFSVFYWHSTIWLSIGTTTAWFLGQASLIYLTLYRWIPQLLKPRRTWLFFIALIATILVTAFITALITELLFAVVLKYYPIRLFPLFGFAALGNLYWGALAVGLAVFRDKLRNERQAQRLEKEHVENELRFLKSQMNPHFLFNAINSIYVLIRKDPDLAERTLASFSDMLRYQLYECVTDFIPIENEITYLDNYIRLEQLRKGNMLALDYSIDENVRLFSIAPLLIIPLVENAFKYVSSFTDQENKVRIALSASDSRFVFEIDNTIDAPPDPSVRSIGGIGLDNVRRRLELLYPGRHDLSIESVNGHFSVVLGLQTTHADH